MITVNDSPPSSLVYSSSPFIFTINTSIPVQIPSYIGTITNCISNPALPTGLSLSPTDCSINGTPTINVSSLSFTITASNSFGSTSVDILITVNNVPPNSLNYSGTPFIFTESLAISSIHPTYSGTITNCISTPTLPLGLTLNPSTCSIDGVPAGVQASTLYTIQASNAFGSTSSNIHIAVNIAPPSSLTYSSSSYTFTQNVTISNLIPTYSGSVSNCSVSPSLPSGLSINSSNCVISGNPANLQISTNYTITATNPSGSTQTSIDIIVNEAAPNSLVYAGTPFVFTQNLTITAQIPSITGTVSSCSSSPSLPVGLVLNPINCTLSGTPISSQSSTMYTITASNTSGSTNALIFITINIPSCFITSGAILDLCLLQ
ncbi:MAG: putative Ig domain-containing protein [Leptospiraceae bacterium]|nr:putative Ig domain-containing protein [Leptospiraceae bacterium]